jgi:hypothetical protein
MMRTAALADAIQRDLLADRPVKEDARKCFTCGRPFMPRVSTGDDNVHRFCSARCREGFDAGAPPFEPERDEPTRKHASWISLKPTHVVAGPPGYVPGELYDPLAKSRRLSRGIRGRGAEGWLIECLGCGKQFDSTGLRCCSTDCERRYRERGENEALMANVGMDAPVKRKCEREGCGRNIPTWRNGRRVSAMTRFCSPKCGKEARKAGGRLDAKERPNSKKVPISCGSMKRPAEPTDRGDYPYLLEPTGRGGCPNFVEPNLCRDCGVDTTPCTGRRGCRHDGKWEWYMVHDWLWKSAGMPEAGYLCIGCLERRIGRELKPDDLIGAELRRAHPWDTPRLASRRGAS